MLFLWAFGPLVEDAMASARFVLFYILGGLVAMSSHVFLGPGAGTPVLDESGFSSNDGGGMKASCARRPSQAARPAPYF